MNNSTTPSPIDEVLKRFREKYHDILFSSGLIETYSYIENFITSELSQATKEAREEGKRAGLMKALSFKIPKNPCSIDYADGFTACQTLCLYAANSKDEITN